MVAAGGGSVLPSTPAGAAFACVLVRDEGLLPAVARLSPVQAAAFVALEGAAGATANSVAIALRESGSGAYLLKAGAVGGPADAPGSAPVRREHAEAIVAALGRGAGQWERDPDFGYEVATGIPGIDAADDGLLVPRFHYARTDRVYEYAAMVPRVRAERRERLGSVAGLDAAIARALG